MTQTRNDLRNTISQAAQALGEMDILAVLESTPDSDLPALSKRLQERGGKQLGRIGDALASMGHRVDGAKTKAQGKFYGG